MVSADGGAGPVGEPAQGGPISVPADPAPEPVPVPAEAGDAASAAGDADDEFGHPARGPYLNVVAPGWPRGTLVGATALLAVLTALADLASAWVLVVLPVLVMVAVAYHEAVHRILHR